MITLLMISIVFHYYNERNLFFIVALLVSILGKLSDAVQAVWSMERSSTSTCPLFQLSLTARPLYPRDWKFVPQRHYFHAPGFVVE